MYTLSFILSRNASVKAIEKIFLIFFSISLIGAIIFSNQVWILLPKILQVYQGSDSVLYLFIIECELSLDPPSIIIYSIFL